MKTEKGFRVCDFCGHVLDEGFHQVHEPNCGRENCSCDIDACQRCCPECIIDFKEMPRFVAEAIERRLAVYGNSSISIRQDGIHFDFWGEEFTVKVERDGRGS